MSTDPEERRSPITNFEEREIREMPWQHAGTCAAKISGE
jgi:hypothetical protein